MVSWLHVIQMEFVETQANRFIKEFKGVSAWAKAV
jgi:hypothetical protein